MILTTSIVLHTLVMITWADSGVRSARYIEWSPPVVHPQHDHVTVQARQSYTLSCEAHKPVSWHLPNNSSDVLDR